MFVVCGCIFLVKNIDSLVSLNQNFHVYFRTCYYHNVCKNNINFCNNTNTNMYNIIMYFACIENIS